MKKGGIIHEGEQGMMGKIASFTWQPSELIISEKVRGKIDCFGAKGPLLHFPKNVAEKNGPERFDKRLDT